MDKHIDFKVIYLKENQGHGNARRISLENTTNELVALMDSDDVSYPNRFEKQLKLFEEDPNLDICGGHITEFVGEENNIIGRREVELTDNMIKKDLKKRCPMNQVTVMFKKAAYELAGGYIDWFCEEDYYLWARMALKGCRFQNIDEDVVNVRTGLDMSSRRGGYKYFKSERRMQRFLLKNKLISFARYIYNVLLRFGGEVILPNSLRNKAFKATRSKYVKKEIVCSNEHGIKKNGNFSVTMCVYGKDNPNWFDKSLNSIVVNQTLKPSELVLVVDGPIPESIQKVIDKYRSIIYRGLENEKI